MKKYNLVVCGGTFDHFHKGHRAFLRDVLSIGNKVLIGLTTDRYIKAKNNSQRIEDYTLRKQQVEEFLDEEKAKSRVQIEAIDDIFIPKIWETLPIEAIVVSRNTIKGAEAINLKRKEQKKSLLKIEIVPLINDQNNEYISSSRIRKGKINREGKLFLNQKFFKKDFVISENLRHKLQKPFGKLYNKILSVKNSDIPYLITVGDITTLNFNRLNLKQDISVIDFYVARKKNFFSFSQLGFTGNEKVVTAYNPPGHITSDLTIKVLGLFNLERERIILKIEGEEDLAVLPLILSAPLNSIIYYGQPGQGVVEIKVSEDIKEKAYNLLLGNTRGHVILK